jgi:hypothetical protein
VSNQLSVSHAWTTTGSYSVALTAYNDSNPGGISATVMVYVTTQQVYYVAAGGTNPVAPFLTWGTAATNIQDAVDLAVPGGTVLVSNGVYATGGRVVYGSLTNRVVINKPITVQSVNGPAVTLIQGYQDTNAIVADDAVRCVYLINNATLMGFTLTDGATRAAGDGNLEQSGGGVWCESTNANITDCVFRANAANNNGGGVVQGTLNYCTLTGNWAGNNGGGGDSSTLNNCILTNNAGNNAGGGAENSILNNCILTGNSAANYGGGADSSILNQCNLIGNQIGGSDSSPSVKAGQSKPVPLLIITPSGGGAHNSTLNNCILCGNQAKGYSFGGGVYGSTLNNCVLMNNSADEAGGGANSSTLNDCVLTNNFGGYGGGVEGCTLTKCTLTANSAENSGGGADGSTLINCMLTNNFGDANGGGANGSTLANCVISGNSSNGSGGGSSYDTLNNCTVVNNSAPSGAGVFADTLNNCIIYYNNGSNYDGALYGLQLNYCCTIPFPGGIGDITNEPCFVNLAGGDFHLQSNSPCINAGNNTYVSVTNDLDGNPRIVGGTVDMGAYEYQTPTSIISYAWLEQYGLPTDGSADSIDSDGDGMNNYAEWRAGTDPTDPSSLLQMLSPTPANNSSGVNISWQSVSGINYFVQRGSDLSAQPAFSTIQSNIVGQAGTTSFTDAAATNSGPYFYRVGVQ